MANKRVTIAGCSCYLFHYNTIRVGTANIYTYRCYRRYNLLIPELYHICLYCYCLVGKSLTQVQQKSLLSFAGMALIVFAFNLFYNGILTYGIRPEYMGYVATYTWVFVAVIWCYKLDTVDSIAVKDIGAI